MAEYYISLSPGVSPVHVLVKPPDARLRAFDAQVATRELEQSLDWLGFSGAGRAVLGRLKE